MDTLAGGGGKGAQPCAPFPRGWEPSGDELITSLRLLVAATSLLMQAAASPGGDASPRAPEPELCRDVQACAERSAAGGRARAEDEEGDRARARGGALGGSDAWIP